MVESGSKAPGAAREPRPEDVSSGALFKKQLFESGGNLLVGTALFLAAYLLVDRYREEGAYKNAFAERRLETLATLWAETDHHCAAVLQAVTKKGATSDDLLKLGVAFYTTLTQAGIFLGHERLQALRARVGDEYLDREGGRLLSKDLKVQAEAVVKFRGNWLGVLEDLSKLGKTNE